MNLYVKRYGVNSAVVPTPHRQTLYFPYWCVIARICDPVGSGRNRAGVSI